MPISKDLLLRAFASLSERTLRKCAEHNGIARHDTASPQDLCRELSKDGINLQSYSSHLPVKELRALALALGVEPGKKKRESLAFEVWSFIENDASIARGLTYGAVFGNCQAPTFEADFEDWLKVRLGQLADEELSEGELLVDAARNGIMTIRSSGLTGVFECGDDAYPFRVQEALRKLGAERAAGVIEAVGRLVFDGSTPKTLDERIDRLVEVEDAHEERLEEAEKKGGKLWDSVEDLEKVVYDYARRNPKKFQPRS